MRSRHSAILRLRSRRRTFGRAPAVAELIDSDGQVTKLIVTELKILLNTQQRLAFSLFLHLLILNLGTFQKHTKTHLLNL